VLRDFKKDKYMKVIKKEGNELRVRPLNWAENISVNISTWFRKQFRRR
jgi:hypothetical protein